jgi:integrase/recombinase XerD
MSSLAPTLQAFFTDRLMSQLAASTQTIAGYRDTFRLLLNFAAERTRKQPCDLDLGDLDAHWSAPSSTTSNMTAAIRSVRATTA